MQDIAESSINRDKTMAYSMQALHSCGAIGNLLHRSINPYVGA
jgi:hypothetical protein